MISVNPQGTQSDDFAPTGPAFANQADLIEGTIEISARIRNGNLDFTMRDIEGNFVRFDHGERYLALTDRTRLTIRLSDVINWSFDTTAGPLRLKKEESAAFYHVQFDQADTNPREITLEAQPTGVDPSAAGAAQTHPFNLYIKVNQRLGSPWPLRLDPDLKNPPPPPV